MTFAVRDSRYQVLFENSPIPQWVFDATTLSVLDVNVAACTGYGYSRDEFLALTILDLRPAEDRASFLATYGAAHQSCCARARHQTRDGRILDVEVSGHRVQEGGRDAWHVWAQDVTAERVARQADSLLHAVVDHSMAGFVVARGGNIVFVNARYGEIVGRPVEELGPMVRIPDLVHEDDRDTVERMLRERVETDSRVQYPCRIVRPDGEVVEIEVYGSAAELGDDRLSVATIVDVTERNRTQAALRESEERFRQLAEHLGGAVHYLVDLTRRRVHYVSPSFADIWGIPVEEIYANPRRWVDGVHPDDRARIMSARSPGHETETLVYRIVRPDGSIRWIEDCAYEVPDEHGRFYRLAGVAWDITERRREQAQRESLEQQLHQAQKMEAVGRLAGGIAHDFNNVLTVIRGSAEFLLQGLGFSDPRRDDAEHIRSAAERATALVRQLLAFSRQQILAPHAIDLNVIVRSLGPMLHRLIGEDIKIELDLSREPVPVVADPTQIQQVIINLVVNAQDAMPAGGHIRLETAVTLLAGERYAVLTVRDTGEGMSPEVMAHIFEPFFTTKEVGKGTGLGLSTVYGIVKQSGGDVEVESTPGAGTTFRILLPYTTTSQPATHTPAEPSVAVRAGTETILLVEDELAVRLVARRILESNGYHVIEAENADQALAHARSHPGAIDLVVTDMVMPGMSGRQLAEHLRTLRPTTRFLYMSGYTDDEMVRRGIPAEDAAFIHKPFTPTGLLQEVGKVIHR